MGLREIIANLDRFLDQCTRDIDSNELTSNESVKLLGIHIDHKLSFNERVSSPCKKASNQLNDIADFIYT